MLTLLALTTAAYLSRRVDASREDGSGFLTVQYEQIWTDLLWFFGLIGALCNWAIDRGRAMRQYFNAELQPWLNRHGVTVTLPQLDLPRLPGRSETQIAE